jgi:heme A synthase
MTNRQLALIIGVTTALALVLAWAIERTQVRRFVLEFDQWWEAKNGGTDAK